MGFLDKMFGKKEKVVESTKSMSQVLRENGIDPKNLDMKVGGDGTVTVKGHVISQGQRDKVAEILKGMPGIKSVNDQTVIGEPAPEPAPEPQVASSGLPGPGPVAGSDASGSGQVSESVEAPPASDAADEGQTYTVESGDTLWKIAEQTLGSGAAYMKIFEANRDILDDPDKIFPGQVLKIPSSQ